LDEIGARRLDGLDDLRRELAALRGEAAGD